MSVDDLTGRWNVERTGGVLPPLVGVAKEIDGARGWTKVGPVPAAPFDVDGLVLRYRAPFAAFADVLERDGDGFRGRATFMGREYGTFVMRRKES